MLRWLPATLLAAIQAGAWGAVLSGGLAGVSAWLLLLSIVPVIGAAVLLASLGLAAWKHRLSRPMAASLLLSITAVWPGAWNLGLAQIAYPASLENTGPQATVRLPTDARVRVAWGGDRLTTNQHAFMPDQRWAYDLVIEPYLNASSRLEDYGCWGTPVVAPAPAKVVAARDGEPDATPGELSNNFDKPFGNFVALELDTETYLVIAHLQPESLTVKTGELVREGQMIGRCGNSGNTSEPHIHIHHQRQNPADFVANFAEGLPLFFRDHDGPPMPEGGLATENGKIVARGAEVHHRTSH